MRLTVRPGQDLLGAPSWQAGQPLWQRVPKHDGAGRLLADFTMIAPSLKGRPVGELAPWLVLVEGALKRFGSVVVFADFNVRIQLLWVSHEARPGLGIQLVNGLRAVAPELLLVGQPPSLAGE